MKRLLDLAITFLTAPLWLPVLVLVALLVRINLGRPVFFIQTRPGLRGVPFRMIKFRTMLDCRDAAGNLIEDEQRLVPFGNWLRASSLDELPELLNVIRGEMSLVGPRPLLLEYLPHYSARQARRHEVRPGITGWAQINGRNALAWDQRLELDVCYVENRSLALDLKILALTFVRVLQCRGIHPPDSLTMPKFTGAITPPVQDQAAEK